MCYGESGTASDHAAMSVDQTAPLVAVAGSQRVTLGRVFLAERLFRWRLRRVLRPACPHLQPEDRGRQPFAGGLARHGEEVLRDLGGRLDSAKVELVLVVEPQRLRVYPDQAGNL